jgi:hypothetical protein
VLLNVNTGQFEVYDIANNQLTGARRHAMERAAPGTRGRINPSTPASLPAAVRLNDLRIVPSGANQAEFPILFPRNAERDLSLMKIGEI